jgi:hypothetical protein
VLRTVCTVSRAPAVDNVAALVGIGPKDELEGMTSLEGLFADHGAPVGLHRGVVGSDQLRRHGAIDGPRTVSDARSCGFM